MVDNTKLTEELNHRKLDNWYLNEEYVKLIYKEIIESEAYQEYMSKSESDYASDKDLVFYPQFPFLKLHFSIKF